MADSVWKVTFKGREYELDLRDLTVGRLRQMKAWYGRDYGTYLTFIQLLLTGEIDAMCCALWIVQSKAGERPPEPNQMDFSLDDFGIEGAGAEDEDEAVDPTGEAPDTPTIDSKATVSSGSSRSTSARSRKSTG